MNALHAILAYPVVFAVTLLPIALAILGATTLGCDWGWWRDASPIAMWCPKTGKTYWAR